MLVGHGIEEPLDIFLGTYDTWQSEDLDGRIVGVNAHVHIALFARGHDGFEEIFHIRTELCLVDTFVEVEEIAEFLYRRLVVLAEVATDEALGLDDDVLNEFVLLLRGHGLGEFITFGQYIAALSYTCGELKLCPFLTCSFALQDVDIEVGKLSIVEVKVG